MNVKNVLYIKTENLIMVISISDVDVCLVCSLILFEKFQIRFHFFILYIREQ